MTRIKNIADRIARQLGYLPASSLPNIEVTWERGQPPHVLIEPPGRSAWRNQVVGYVFPTLDGRIMNATFCLGDTCSDGHES